MGVEGSFFEPQPWNFRKLDIFWRCSNVITINFWNSLWGKTCQKYLEAIRPGNPEVHVLACCVYILLGHDTLICYSKFLQLWNQFIHSKLLSCYLSEYPKGRFHQKQRQMNSFTFWPHWRLPSTPNVTPIENPLKMTCSMMEKVWFYLIWWGLTDKLYN